MQAITVGASQAITVGRPSGNGRREPDDQRRQGRGRDDRRRVQSTGGKGPWNGRGRLAVGHGRQGRSIGVAKKLTIDAGEEILIKTGDAQLLMKKDGTISLKGKDIAITGSGKITVKATGDMVLKGSKIAEN